MRQVTAKYDMKIHKKKNVIYVGKADFSKLMRLISNNIFVEILLTFRTKIPSKTK